MTQPDPSDRLTPAARTLPATKSGRSLFNVRGAHLPYCAVFVSGDLGPDGEYACGCNLDSAIVGVEQEARDDAAAQTAAAVKERDELRDKVVAVRRYVTSNLEVWSDEHETISGAVSRDWLTKILNVIDTGNPLLSKSEEQERG